jgi:hypothetical protein
VSYGVGARQVVETYRNGTKHGPYEKTDKDGVQKGQYVDGKKDGAWIWTGNNGQTLTTNY